MSDEQATIDAYYRALAAGEPVVDGTIPRSFGGPSQAANDIALADPTNDTDVATIAAVYFHGDEAEARSAISLTREAEGARDHYALARDAGAGVGPANPFFAGIPERDKVLQYQIAAGVPRTALNPGITLEAARDIYDLNPNGPPTDLG